MKDDLLIKFIDDRCTPSEAEQAIRELSGQGSGASEWVQMLNAAKLAGTPAFEPVEDAQEYVSEVIARSAKAASRKKIFRLSAIVGGICAVAASVAVFIVYHGNGGMNPVTGGALAFVQDSLETAPKADTVIQAPTQETLGHPSVPETPGHPSVQEIPVTPSPKDAPLQAESLNPQNGESSGEAVPQLVPTTEYSRNASRAEVTDSSASDTPAAAPEQRQERKLRMTRPSKSPYRVKVKDLSKDFLFEWTIEGQPSRASLLVNDSTGEVVVRKSLENPEADVLPVAVMDLTDRGELVWTLVLEFPDGEMLSRTGRLEMKSEMN